MIAAVGRHRAAGRRTAAMRRMTASAPGDSLFKQVTETIAVAILSGDLQAGELVPTEPDPASSIAPSRSVYREAIKYLSAKGLIEARQRSGTRVAPRSAWNLIDPDILRWALQSRIDEDFVKHLYELRLFVEPNGARLAAERASPAQVAAISEALAAMAARAPYSEEVIDADVAFHAAILKAANNPALACLGPMIAATLHWSMRLQRGKPPSAFQLALADHQRVCRAIAERRPDQAHAFMTTLVLDALSDTLAAFRRAPGQVNEVPAAE